MYYLINCHHLLAYSLTKYAISIDQWLGDLSVSGLEYAWGSSRLMVAMMDYLAVYYQGERTVRTMTVVEGPTGRSINEPVIEGDDECFVR